MVAKREALIQKGYRIDKSTPSPSPRKARSAYVDYETDELEVKSIDESYRHSSFEVNKPPLRTTEVLLSHSNIKTRRKLDLSGLLNP